MAICDKECLRSGMCVNSQNCSVGRIQPEEPNSTGTCRYFLMDENGVASIPVEPLLGDIKQMNIRPVIEPGTTLYVVNALKGIVQYSVAEVFERADEWYIKLKQDKGSITTTETMNAKLFQSAVGKTIFRKYRDALLSLGE